MKTILFSLIVLVITLYLFTKTDTTTDTNIKEGGDDDNTPR